VIGDFVVVGRTCYLRTNAGGTLEKLPRMRWWWVVWFAFKCNVLGRPITKSDVYEAIGGGK